MTGDPIDTIPITVLTGYLGAGKTTLLGRLLRRPEFQRTAVIINELGEIGIDHDLVERSDETVLELEGGCLCCRVRGDLVRALDRLWRDRARAKLPDFDRVVIETSGLADPAPILQTLMVDPVTASRYRIEGVVAVVDAVNGPATLDRETEAVKQVAMADRIVISKTDLSDPTAWQALEGRLRGLNATARILRAVRGAVDPAALLDTGPWNPATKSPQVESWLGEAALQAVAANDHDHDHVRDDVAHGPGALHDHAIRTFSIRREEPLSAAAASLLLTLLTAQRGPNLLRVKGLLALREEPERPLVVHAVQHVVHEPIELDRWPSADRSSRLVLVTRDLPASVVEELWDAVVAYEAAHGAPTTPAT